MEQLSSSAVRKPSSRPAFLLGILSVAAILTGVLLILTLGGSSGRDLAAGATGEAIVTAAPLLAFAELLKLATATCQQSLVRTAAPAQDRWRDAALLIGYAGAFLIAASGIVGLYAVAAHVREAGAWASSLGFGSAAATAIWVLLFVNSTTLHLKRWHRIAGVAFAALSLVSLVLAPAALLAGVVGLSWWFGLARAFASIGNQAKIRH